MEMSNKPKRNYIITLFYIVEADKSQPREFDFYDLLGVDGYTEDITRIEIEEITDSEVLTIDK